MDRMSNGKLALVFFSPILIFGISVGLAYLADSFSGGLFTAGFYGSLIAMFYAPFVIAYQFNLASSTPSFGRAVAFFLLAVIAEVFLVKSLFRFWMLHSGWP